MIGEDAQGIPVGQRLLEAVRGNRVVDAEPLVGKSRVRSP